MVDFIFDREKLAEAKKSRQRLFKLRPVQISEKIVRYFIVVFDKNIDLIEI